MSKFPALLASSVLGFGVANAQPQPSFETERDAISALEFLTGKWEGKGISYGSDGAESEYFDTEHVRFDLNQNLLLINARGERGGEQTYALHTIIYFDLTAQRYMYTPYSGRHRGVVPTPMECTLEDEKLHCITTSKTFRLTFQRLDDGAWNEFGERKTDGKWRKTFETILSAAE